MLPISPRPPNAPSRNPTLMASPNPSPHLKGLRVVFNTIVEVFALTLAPSLALALTLPEPYAMTLSSGYVLAIH